MSVDFPAPGSAREPHHGRLARVGVELADELPSGRVVGLHERDGASQRALVARAQALGQGGGVGARHRAAQTTLAPVEPVLSPTVPGDASEVGAREAPGPLRGGPLALGRFLLGHGMLSPRYLRLYAAWPG
jgi:hypothetical protein